jgi:phage shock protein C
LHVGLDESLGDAGCEQGFTRGTSFDCVEEFCRWSGLEQKTGRSGAQCVENVFIQVDADTTGTRKRCRSNPLIPPPQPPVRKLYRSQSQRMWAGVCGGLAEYFHVDVTLMRVLFVAMTILSGGLGLLVYLTSPCGSWSLMKVGSHRPRADERMNCYEDTLTPSACRIPTQRRSSGQCSEPWPRTAETKGNLGDSNPGPTHNELVPRRSARHRTVALERDCLDHWRSSFVLPRGSALVG